MADSSEHDIVAGAVTQIVTVMRMSVLHPSYGHAGTLQMTSMFRAETALAAMLSTRPSALHPSTDQDLGVHA